jgi:hypothetical protein
MKNIRYNRFLILLAMLGLLSSCILEDVEPEYKVVGSVATVTNITPSKLIPAAGEAITVKALYYSEHEPVVELRFYANVGGGGLQLLETRAVSNHNVNDSYEVSFNYTVPADAATDTVIIFRVEAETSSGFSNGISTPATGVNRVRVG